MDIINASTEPGINMTTSSTDAHGNQLFYAFEACDACEADEYGCQIGNVLVSDFVYPDWFGGVAGAQFDKQSKIAKPFEILSGGYIGVWTPTTGWTQVTGKEAHGAAHRSRSGIGSRRERRAVGRDRWAPSTVE